MVERLRQATGGHDIQLRPCMVSTLPPLPLSPRLEKGYLVNGQQTDASNERGHPPPSPPPAHLILLSKIRIVGSRM